MSRLQWTLLGIILVVAALLRLPLLERVPNGLLLDEASRGYDAYALAQTGADQYGVGWPLFAEGLDDYTPALFTYLATPFVALVGPTELAVRLPAAILGVASVGLAYLVASAFFDSWVGLGTAALLAISPWHILPSRTGAEWVLLPAFTMLGTWLALRGMADDGLRTRDGGRGETDDGRRPSGRDRWLLVAGVVLGLGMYSYAFARLLLPLLVLGFTVGWQRELRARWRFAALGALASALLAAPVLAFSITEAGQARLRAVAPLGRLGAGDLFGYMFGNYLSYFWPPFLAWGIEPTYHHNLEGFGPVLPLMVPLVAVGLADAVRLRDRARLFWLWWLVAAPAASALHRESPSAVLLLGAIPSWQLFAALGGSRLVCLAGSRSRTAAVVLLGAIVTSGALTALLAARALYRDYPVYAAADWEYGAGQAVRLLEERRSAYDDVLVSDRLDTPHVYVLFYAPVDPASYQRAPIHVRQPNVRSRGEIGAYRFGRLPELLDRPGRHLVWLPADEAATLFPTQAPLLAIPYPDGRPAQAVYEARR